MARPTVIYNCQALFVGPAPKSGYNFLSYIGGDPTDDYSSLVQKINKLNPIDRIQSVSYSINTPHTDIVQINQRGLVDRPYIDYPSVDLSFDYLLCGTKNESRLGFNVNYPLFNFPFSGESFYEDNQNVSLLSGFFEKNESKELKYPWQDFPLNQYRDCRNIYAVVNPDKEDINRSYFKENFVDPDIYQSIDPAATGYNVIGFGNCYLNSYNTQGAVGGFASASVSYTAYNINFDMSGSGFQAPGIETQSGKISPEKSVIIPRVLSSEGYAALTHGDITISTDSFSGLGVDFDSLHIQSYDISIELNREPLNNLGYKFPVKTLPTSTIYANLSLEGFVDSGNSGSLIDLIAINSGYNFTIKVDPKQTCPKSLAAPINAGTIPINQEDEALRYTFIGAKLNDFSYNSSIGDNKVFSASFNVEVDPDNLTEGFFISGVYGMEKVEDFILLEGTANGDDQNGFYLQQETNDLLVTNLLPAY